MKHKLDKGQAGVEVTPEMIEAGVRVYEDWVPGDFSYQYTEPELVRGVFLAMMRARAELVCKDG